jgi:ABC-type molybdenum transport system ATPase subunit/photorepair protein PhrA
MLTASSMYALNINECASLIENVGPKRTVVIRGDMGWGKTSILKILKAPYPLKSMGYIMASPWCCVSTRSAKQRRVQRTH